MLARDHRAPNRAPNFLIFDEEVIDNVLFLPPPEEHLSPLICLKVFDAEFGLPSSYFGKECEDLEDSDGDEEGYSGDEDDYESWL